MPCRLFLSSSTIVSATRGPRKPEMDSSQTFGKTGNLKTIDRFGEYNNLLERGTILYNPISYYAKTLSLGYNKILYCIYSIKYRKQNLQEKYFSQNQGKKKRLKKLKLINLFLSKI